MNFSVVQWHDRFVQQARWTHDLRTHLFNRINLASARIILDVGCGTGAIFSEIGNFSNAILWGVDFNVEFLKFASANNRGGIFNVADAHNLPFSSGKFDVAFCHFLLLWVSNPLNVIKEMRRITRDNGVVLALAEPDYGGRIDYPTELSSLGDLQFRGLKQQGANPEMGRQLTSLFNKAGLTSVETGVLGGQWRLPLSEREWEGEWAMLRSDLSNQLNERDLDYFQELDREAWISGVRVLFVPTFYALGYVPENRP